MELLARHHGLESQVLDWTESPFIASYFALLDVAKGGTARVWMLNRFALPSGAPSSSIELIDDPELLRFNRRALQQRSVFMRVNSAQESLEKAMRPALYACDLPGTDRRPALSEFDAININGTSLFGDLDGVARTVRARMFSRD